jgi:Ti-type conjugative transfer relaxase TraA
MAIQFARIEIVGRSSGGNACCKGAYNARSIIKDQKTNLIYNFSNRGDNVYHNILLPEYVNEKFSNLSEFMNLIESSEKRKDSQLLKDIVLALPDDQELNLQDRIEITKRLIIKRGWIKEGLGVQIDIHQPHDGEKNWHAHLLVTTRRFTEDGLSLGSKAVDLNPEFKKAENRAYIIPEDQQIHEDLKEIINNYFKELGLENRVDAIGINPQEHIGPVRMRNVMNAAAMRNEERRIAEIEHLSSGAAVLDKITRHMSVFSKSDLERAVKCIDNPEVRETLVEEALANNSVIRLFTESGSKTSFFTTKEIRLEESKILRLSGYVANVNNVFGLSNKDSFKPTQELMESARDSLSQEQYTALSELITSTSGLNILRGRAGVGKSHVLRKLATIAKANNINVIGLAPTHKAKEALAADGFGHTDTIKGMLFKLANSRFSLPKNSLLIVDEAGMIGNDDYSELLRVAATRRCSVILSGDERQLASVQRGGMFEVFAGIYGSSTIFDIKRQTTSWGKEVAQSFASGEVARGVTILEQEQRIKRQENSSESMQSLLADWNNSEVAVSDRLILAVKNKDVAALNHGAREYLKLDGKLMGVEIEVGGNHYMKGDRILIGKTDKHLGVVNGEIGELLEISKGRFVVAIQNSNTKSGGNSDNKNDNEIIEFNPAQFNSFRHGYATTVFKAQGASIKDVYVFHDGFAGLRNSYVALSRNINELNLYINNKSILTSEHLIKQLSYDPELGSSLHYCTEIESKTHQDNAELLKNIGTVDKFLLSVHDFASRNITKLTDKYLPSAEYYNYKEPKKNIGQVTQVIDKVFEQNQNNTFAEDVVVEKLVVGGVGVSLGRGENNVHIGSHANIKDNTDTDRSHNNNPQVNNASLNSKQSAKSRFYANADYARGNKQKSQNIAEKDLRLKWDRETETLRKEASFKAQVIARDLLGEPNKRLSNGRELRFGENGKIAVRISGERSGTWYDFSKGAGGDIFALIREQQGCDFKGAVNYLRQSFGIQVGSDIGNSRADHNISSSLRLVHDFENSNTTAKYIKEQQSQERIDKAKQVAAGKLHENSSVIKDDTIAHQYLAKVRGISCELGQDIKEANIYDKEKALHFPALVAFARDDKGSITGGMQVLLDGETGNKANVAIPKKSFGKIAGSFIDVSDTVLISSILKQDGLSDSSDNCIESTHTTHINNIDKLDKYKITIIAEGLETALSIKQALSNDPSNADKEFKVLCSLGVSNIKNYKPKSGERIIIAADNDGASSVTEKTIENAKTEFANKGAFVEIVRPNKEGDFNDMLKGESQIKKGKAKEEKEVARTFNRALRRHTAVTLGRYFADKEDRKALSEQEKNHIDYLSQFKVAQDKIVDAYRADSVKGRKALEKTVKPIVIAHDYVKDSMHTINSANLYGAKINRNDLTLALAGKNLTDMDRHLFGIREKHYFSYSLNELAREKRKVKTPQEGLKVLKAEQRFLSSLYENHLPGIHNKELLNSIKGAHLNEQHDIFGKLEKLTTRIETTQIKSSEVTSILKYSTDPHSALKGLTEKYHGYVAHVIQESLNNIDKGMQVIANKKPFTCKIKLLEHMLNEHKHNEFFPKNNIEQIHKDLLRNQKQLTRSFDGPTLG